MKRVHRDKNTILQIKIKHEDDDKIQNDDQLFFMCKMIIP